MKNSSIVMSGVATLVVIFILYSGYGLWRGLSAIRRFPVETVDVMQPVIERVYKHKADTGQWPTSLDDIGLGDVVMPRLASPSYKVVDESTAQIRVHGPGHQFLSFMFFEDENLRENTWKIHGEGKGGEIRCPSKPW